jgi:hypothetical protein
MKSFYVVVLLLAILSAGYTSMRVKVYACAGYTPSHTHSNVTMAKKGALYCTQQ